MEWKFPEQSLEAEAADEIDVPPFIFIWLFFSPTFFLFPSVSLSFCFLFMLLFIHPLVFLPLFQVAQVKSPEVSATEKVAAVIHLSLKWRFISYRCS